MDENMTNEVIAEDIRADFYQFCMDSEWDDARSALESLEDMRINTYELRRFMNSEMAAAEEVSKVDEEKWENLRNEI